MQSTNEIKSFIIQFQDLNCDKLLNPEKKVEEAKIEQEKVVENADFPPPPVLSSKIEEEKEQKKEEYKFPIDSNYKFGVIQLEMNNTPISTERIDINLMMDMSGSMGDTAGNGFSKGAVASHTTKNIITSLSKLEESTITQIASGKSGCFGFERMSYTTSSSFERG